MRIPSPTSGTVNRSREAAQYFETHTPDLSPLARGIQTLGASLAERHSATKQRAEQHDRFEATRKFIDFNLQSDLRLKSDMDAAAPDDLNFADRSVASYETYENDFIAGLKPELQDEFRTRAAEVRQQHVRKAVTYEAENLKNYYKTKNNEIVNGAKSKIAENPDSLEAWRQITDEAIATSNLSEAEKYDLRAQNAKQLETLAYAETLKRRRTGEIQYSNDLSQAARSAAHELGTTPEDLLTVMSYETGGKFSTSIRGGAGNRHIGLIQFGKEEQKKYGVYQGQPVGEQMKAVVRYLKDRGFKPGMGLLDLYSTINAGSPGRYEASDANNGGAPGSVQDKVAQQMEGHKANAARVLGGTYAPEDDDLDTDTRFANVPYEDRVAIRADVESGVARTLKAQQDALEQQRLSIVNNLYNGLADGTNGRLDYENLVEQGVLVDYDERKKALGIIEEHEKAGADLRNFQTKLQSGGLFDPTDGADKKGADAWFGDNGRSALEARDPKYISDTMAPFFAKTGMLPPKAVDLLSVMSRSGDPRNMLYAQQALSILENQNSVAYAQQVPESLRNRADVWEVLRGILPEKDLIERMQEGSNQETRTVRELLRTEARTQLTSAVPPVKFESAVEALGGVLPGDGLKAKSMEIEWRTLLQENYVKTGGNWEAAQAITNKQLARVWNTTNIGGEGVLMRHPPERYYPMVGGSHDWMNVQLRGELGIAEDESVQLISDNRTQADIEAGRPPSYLVATEKDGVWRLATDDQNRQVRQIFKPIEEDLKTNELQLRLEAKQTELQHNMQFIAGVGGVGVPQEITDKVDQLNSDILDIKEQISGTKQKAKERYATPAQTRRDELQRKVDTLMQELDASAMVVEEWPKSEELGQALTDLEEAKKAADEELAKKRKPLEQE